MPRRHSCQHNEAGNDCPDPRCFHAADNHFYLFDNLEQAVAFAFGTPTRVQMIFLALMDLGYDEDDPLDELE